MAIVYIIPIRTHLDRTSRAGYEPEPITGVSEKFLSLEAKEKRAELSQVRDHANAIANTITKALEPKRREHSDR